MRSTTKPSPTILPSLSCRRSSPARVHT
jgi:hypothetical protein